MPNYSPYDMYQQRPQQTYLPASTTNSFYTVLVNGESGANSYPVASGNTVLLMDFDAGKFWLKSTNVNGIPQQLRCFGFKEEIQEPQISNSTVSREEFNELSQNVMSLTNSINKLISDLGGDN